jgi:3-hydroxyisobutyrate dehydrogenase
LIGLGAMGRPIAKRLVELGFDLTVYNRTRRPSIKGTRSAATAREAAEGAHAAITIVSDGDALRAVMLGKDGVLAARTPPRVVVDMSTVGRRTALALAKKAEAKGIAYVDAPVSGSVGPASRGELVGLVGASKAALRLAKPVLEALCRKIVHAGPAGAGQALKVVLNGIGAHHFVAFSSMLALGERAGLSRKVLVEAFTQGAFATPSYIGKAPRVLARDYANPDFSLALALKDARLNVELQREVGAHLPVLRAILRDVEKGVDEGLGDLDLFALEKHYNR